MYETERGGRKREHKNVDPNETGKETTRGTIPTEAIRWARWWIPPSHQIKIFLAKTLPYDYHKPSLHRYRASHFLPLPTQGLPPGLSVPS